MHLPLWNLKAQTCPSERKKVHLLGICDIIQSDRVILTGCDQEIVGAMKIERIYFSDLKTISRVKTRSEAGKLVSFDLKKK